MAGQIKLVKVNVGNAHATAARFQVRAVPTLPLMRKGEVVARQAGAVPLPALRSWVERAARVPP